MLIPHLRRPHLDEAEPRVERGQFRSQVDDVEIEAGAAGAAAVVFDDLNQQARQARALVRRINSQHREVPGAAVDFHMNGRPQPSRRLGIIDNHERRLWLRDQTAHLVFVCSCPLDEERFDDVGGVGDADDFGNVARCGDTRQHYLMNVPSCSSRIA